MGRKVQMKAPYVSKGYMDQFLKLVKRVRLSEINASVLRQYEVASPGNESKMLAALRFLGVVTIEGQINEKNLNKLRLEGQSYKEALNELVKEAYKNLFDVNDLSKATETDLKNYFVRTYDYSQQQARMASILFIFLCIESEIPLSEELMALSDTKVKIGKERNKKSKIPETKKSGDQKIVQQEIRNMIAHQESPQEGYVFYIVSKNFSLQEKVKNKKELEKLLKIIEIKCDFEE